MVLNDTLAYRQSHTQTRVFCCVKCFEYITPISIVNTRTVVRNTNLHIVVIFNPGFYSDNFLYII